MDLAAQLFRGFEIVQRHFRQRRPIDGDDALVAVLGRPLVDGECQVSRAQQRGRIRAWVGTQQRLQPVGVGAGIAAQFPGIGAVGQQHRDRAVALGLQAERSAEFQRRRQRGGHRQGLAGQPGDDGVVVVARQQRVGQRAQAHQAPAHRAARQEERQHPAGDDEVGDRRAAAVEEGRCIGHGPKIGSAAARGYRPRMTRPYCLRDLSEPDADAAAALVRIAFAAQSVPTDPPASALRVVGDDVRAHLSAGGAGAVAAGADGLAGVVLWKPDAGGLYVGRLAVPPAWRRRGVARALLARAEAAARAAGWPRLWLDTRLVLADNRALFAAAGFAEISLHAHPGYSEPTFVRMEKWLATPSGSATPGT